MRKPTKKIPLEKKKYLYDQNESWSGDAEDEKKEVYARSIGLFLMSFSSLESYLDMMLTEIINSRSSEPGLRIIKYLNVRIKINLTRDYYNQMISWLSNDKDKKKKELDIIISKLEEISEFRNKVAHADWSSLEENGFVRVSIKEDGDGSGIYFESVKMTPGVIRKFIRQSESIENKISDFMETQWK